MAANSACAFEDWGQVKALLNEANSRQSGPRPLQPLAPEGAEERQERDEVGQTAVEEAQRQGKAFWEGCQPLSQ
jgi:hypothetical protein